MTKEELTRLRNEHLDRLFQAGFPKAANLEKSWFGEHTPIPDADYLLPDFGYALLVIPGKVLAAWKQCQLLSVEVRKGFDLGELRPRHQTSDKPYWIYGVRLKDEEHPHSTPEEFLGLLHWQRGEVARKMLEARRNGIMPNLADFDALRRGLMVEEGLAVIREKNPLFGEEFYAHPFGLTLLGSRVRTLEAPRLEISLPEAKLQIAPLNVYLAFTYNPTCLNLRIRRPAKKDLGRCPFTS